MGPPNIHVCTPKESTDPPNIGHNYYSSLIFISCTFIFNLVTSRLWDKPCTVISIQEMLLNPFLTLLWVYTHTHTTTQMNGVLCSSASSSPSTQTRRKLLGGATGTLTAKWPRRIEVHSGTRPHDPFQVGAYLCWIFKKLNGFTIIHKTYDIFAQ